MLFSTWNGNRHTTVGACSRYRSTRFRRVRSARLHSSQASAMSGRSGATCANPADTVWLAFCPSGSSSSRFSGAFGLAPPGLVCGRADWSPSFATRASRVPTSFLTRCTSHSDSTPLPRCRILVPILPSAPVLASRSVSAMTNRRRHKIQISC